MKCPIDDAELVMTDRSGVEIDYCSKCRGVWLDRGELDKIIERSDTASSGMTPPTQQPRMQAPQKQYESRDYDDDDYGHHGNRRKKGMLGELFDF